MSEVLSASSVASAMPWISTDEIAGVRAATAEEREGIEQVLAGHNILYDFRGNDFLVHEGDLHVRGHFKSRRLLLVRGDLRVDGVYDDDRSLPFGFVAVLGDMWAKDVCSYASLYVQGDLRVEGLIVTYHYDFTFEVGGRVHADGLLVSEKDAHYQPGELGFQLDDRYDSEDRMSVSHKLRHENGLRRLLPRFFSSPRFRDAVYRGEDSAHLLRFDVRALIRAMREGRPVLRETEAPAELRHWLEAALDFDADDASLLALIGRDPLVDQLMAAREELSAVVAEALARGGDPIVLEWLIDTHPGVVLAQPGQSLQPGVAQRLAAACNTDEATLERIARSPDAEVRAALAKRTDPPVALILLLAQDPEPAVRSAILTEGFNVLALEPEALAPLVESADRPLANALARASLSLEEVDALLPRMDRMGHIHLAESLWRQSLGVQPMRMSAEQRVQLIDRLLAMSQMDGSARASAFLALDGAQQAERVAVLQQGDVDKRLMRLAAPEFVDWLLALAAEAGRAPTELGLNRGLSPDRQRRVFEVSLKAPEKERLRALEDLANNDCLEPDIAEALIRYSFQLGMLKRFDVEKALQRRGECGRQPSVAEQIGRVPEPIETWRESWHLPVLSSEAWSAILARHQGLGARLKLKEWAAIGELEARRRAQP